MGGGVGMNRERKKGGEERFYFLQKTQTHQCPRRVKVSYLDQTEFLDSVDPLRRSRIRTRVL